MPQRPLLITLFARAIAAKLGVKAVLIPYKNPPPLCDAAGEAAVSCLCVCVFVCVDVGVGVDVSVWLRTLPASPHLLMFLNSHI
jgi:hypothetical protein